MRLHFLLQNDVFPIFDVWECGRQRRSFTPLPTKHIKIVKYKKNSNKLTNLQKSTGIKLRVAVKPMYKGGTRVEADHMPYGHIQI